MVAEEICRSLKTVHDKDVALWARSEDDEFDDSETFEKLFAKNKDAEGSEEDDDITIGFDLDDDEDDDGDTEDDT